MRAPIKTNPKATSAVREGGSSNAAAVVEGCITFERETGGGKGNRAAHDNNANWPRFL